MPAIVEMWLLLVYRETISGGSAVHRNLHTVVHVLWSLMRCLYSSLPGLPSLISTFFSEKR